MIQRACAHIQLLLQSLDLVGRHPGLEVSIFSGVETGAIEQALAGEKVGTLIRAD
jgi:isopentenyl phosphate kinase